MLQQEFDGVIHIRAVVHVFGGFLVVDMRVHLQEIAFGHIPAAHVLIHNDVPGFFKFIRRANLLSVLIFAVGSNAVGGAVNQNRIGLRSVLGNIDGSKQLLPVAHGNAVFVLGVMRLYVVFFRSFLRRVLSAYHTGGERAADSKHTYATSEQIQSHHRFLLSFYGLRAFYTRWAAV